MNENKNLNRSFLKQFPRNLIVNIIYFFINVIIGILLVPYFISTLGIAAYGFIPLTTAITGYVGIIIQSLNTAISRYLTIDLQRGDYPAANRTFNTAFFGLSAVFLLILPVIIVVAYFVPMIFNIPAGQEKGAILLFLGVSIAFILRLWTGNFTVQLFAYNRLDLQNLVNLTNLLVQTGLIVFFFTVFGPDLGLVGGAYLIGAIAASVVSISLARKVCPYLILSFHSFDREQLKDLCGLGGWVVIDQIGTLFLFQIDLIVVNLLFGATSTGEYAIALQWGILMRYIAGMLGGIFAPMILTFYAQKKIDVLTKITQSAVKFMGLILALVAGLICGFAPQLLTLWVGAQYVYLAPLMILLTATLAINMSVLPLFSINVAHNKMKIPGLMTILFGIANLILAIVIPSVTGWGYYGVAIAGVFVLSCRHLLFVPWYAARLQNVPMAIYLKSLIFGILALIFIGGAAKGITVVISLPPLITLIFGSLCIMGVYGIVILRFGLTSFERGLFESYLPPEWKKSIEKFVLVRKIKNT